MHITKITRTLALAGFVPACKITRTYCGLLPALVLCAVTAIALPAQTYTTLHSFDGTDGNQPYAGLVQATNGDFYGTTTSNGTVDGACAFYGQAGCGTVFKITPSGTLTTLHSFCAQSGCPDGSNPVAGLVQAANGDLYGTTFAGGANSNAACSANGEPSCGTIFKITPSGTLTTLYSFCAQSNCTDGANPWAGLVQATNGDLYGTTNGGGAYPADCGPVGCGTVFKITLSGTLTTLHTFGSQSATCTDGANPYGGLVQAFNGDFYGTTADCGADGSGTVFKITPGGTLTMIHTFCSIANCADGEAPYAGLIQTTDGDLYGTTTYGGTNGQGTVFKITPSGTLTTLYSFCSETNCADGYYPEAALVQATNGDLYGTATYGGTGLFYGTIFQITPGGTFTTLYSFCAQSGCTDGDSPAAGLIQATDGTLYGTTVGGGAYGAHAGTDGTVFSLSVGLGPFVETQTTSGEVGTVVKILGSDLTGATSVSFNGTAAIFNVSAYSLITTVVPAGATSGKVQVVTPSRTLSSNVPFRVLP